VCVCVAVPQHPATVGPHAVPAPAPNDDDDDDLIYEVCDPPSRDPDPPVTSSSQDYANMYYARWDSSTGGTAGDELAFHQGDVLVIVSRQFDEFGWWVASLNGSVGLVPKQYLTPAYQLVNGT